MHKRLHKALRLCRSLNELLRMELLFSDKLHRDLRIRTLLDFPVHIACPLVLHWPNVKELRPQRILPSTPSIPEVCGRPPAAVAQGLHAGLGHHHL